METTWIVAADPSRARILQLAGRKRRRRSFSGSRKNLGREVGKLLSEELDKDLSWFNVRELEKYVARENGRAR